MLIRRQSAKNLQGESLLVYSTLVAVMEGYFLLLLLFMLYSYIK
jgi:hypothetical protein